MSNTAILTSLSSDIAAIDAAVLPVSHRVPSTWSAAYLDQARGHLAQARFAIDAGAQRGVDPVIEVAAA